MNRKLDAAIAGALEYEVKDWADRSINPNFWMHDGDLRWYKVPNYSSNGNAMLELDREMTERGYGLFLDRYFIRPPWDRNEVIYGAAYYPAKSIKTDKTKQYAKTEPLARARAAHYALTGKEWQREE